MSGLIFGVFHCLPKVDGCFDPKKIPLKNKTQLSVHLCLCAKLLIEVISCICEFGGTTRHTTALFYHSDLPYDETCDDGSPGDTAGIGSFGVFFYVLAAAAQADQIYCQN